MQTMQERSASFWPVCFTVFAGFVGLSLPFPVFSTLFLRPESGFLEPGTSVAVRNLLLGIAIALFPVGQAVASPLLGAWSDHFGRKRVLQLSLIVACAGMLLVACAIRIGSLSLLLLGRVIAGLGEANITIAQSIASDVGDRTMQARFFAAISIAMNAGWIVGPLLGGSLGDANMFSVSALELPFWFASLLYLVNMAVVAGGIAPDRDSQTIDRVVRPVPPGPQSREPSIFSGAFRAVLVLTCLGFFGTYTMFSYFSAYLVSIFQMPPFQIGLSSALLSVPLICAGLVSEKATSSIGAPQAAAAGLLLLTIGTGWLVLPDSLMGLAVPATIVAFGIVFVEVATALLVAETAPAGSHGKAMGIYRSAIVITEIVAAFACGWLAGFGPTVPFLVAAGAIPVGIPLILRLYARRDRYSYNVRPRG